MEFEWDPKKAAQSLRKHGVPFAAALRVFLDEDRLEWTKTAWNGQIPVSRTTNRAG